MGRHRCVRQKVDLSAAPSRDRRAVIGAWAGAVVCAGLLLLSLPVRAQDMPAEPPASLEDLQEIEGGEASEIDLEELQIRRDAQREAALSLGARGGLIHQSHAINRGLEMQANTLDETFNFRALLIPAPSGLLIEPPVISEAENALIIAEAGQLAALSERVYAINEQVRIVSAPRHWRSYLVQDWGDLDPPSAILLPQDREERRAWRRWVAEGWAEGVQQANEIFDTNLARLVADFTGMVRFRKLLAQGIVSAPFAQLTERGVTGGGRELRVGDRSVVITGQPQFDPQAERWTPADR